MAPIAYYLRGDIAGLYNHGKSDPPIRSVGALQGHRLFESVFVRSRGMVDNAEAHLREGGRFYGFWGVSSARVEGCEVELLRFAGYRCRAVMSLKRKRDRR